jgi:hypothetical protein
MSIDGRHPALKEICDALGLKHVRRLDIHMEVNSLVLVSAEFYPEKDGIVEITPILRKYHLVVSDEDK